jgi:hypothetical protein
MITVPMMVTAPGDTSEDPVIHFVGRDRESGDYVTACGKEATDWPAILAYTPTCPDCIDVLEGGNKSREAAWEKFLAWVVKRHGSSSRSLPAVKHLRRGFEGGWSARAKESNRS